jgi:hypothetical protein
LCWYGQWKYSLPAPVAAAYHAVEQKGYIDISERLHPEKTRPVFLQAAKAERCRNMLAQCCNIATAKITGEKIDMCTW